MIHSIPSNLTRRHLTRHSYRHIPSGLAAAGARAGPRLLRTLILALLALIFIFVGLMLLTDHYEAGPAVLGSILLIALGAAQNTRYSGSP